jgi:hypothetical protein
VPVGYALAPDFAEDGSRCATCPLADCRLPTKPGKGLFAIKNTSGQAGDRTQWSWVAGAATSIVDFANPADVPGNGYTLCVYDGNGDVVSSVSAPAGGFCGRRPCWQLTRHGYNYRNSDVSGSGLARSLQVILKEGSDGKARISVVQKGSTIPALPLAEPLRVQLVNGAGTCWEARYSAPAIKDDAGRFMDKND